MDFNKLIDSRYTTKTYKMGIEISDIDLDKIIHAIHYSPTASNLQNSRAIIIKNKELKEQISKFYMPLNRDRVNIPPILILFIGKKIEDVLSKDGKHIWENAVTGLKMTDEEIKNYVNSVIKFYQGYIDSGIELATDVIASSIQCTFAMIQSFELGYESTIMLGYKKDKLKEFLIEEGLMSNDENINLSLSIGKEVDNDETNNLSRIKKRAPIQNIIKII